MFIWIGILILQEPEVWGGFIQPWAEKLLPAPINDIMIGTAFFDIAIGILMILDIFTSVAAFLGTLHIAGVLLVSGVNEVTVRNIGLITACFTLGAQSWPPRFNFWRRH